MNSTSVCEITVNVDNVDLKEVCRVCLLHHNYMYYLFGYNNDKVDKIEFCSGVRLKEEKELSNLICKTCLNRLSIAHKFKTMCILSEDVLQQVLLKKVKLETPDEIPIKENSITDYGADDDNGNGNGNVKCEDDDQDGISSKKVKDVDLEEQSRQQKLEVPEREVSKPESTIYKRGPYKKEAPQRLKKFKFARLKCELCDIKFTNKKESDDHKKEVHHERLIWICEVCGKKFRSRSSYCTHVRAHRPRRLLCAHCDYRCVTKSDIEKHLRTHSGIKKFKCASCSAGFHTSSNLHDHERRMHIKELPRYPCHLCPKRFFDRTKLNRHVDTHLDCKRFKCDLCTACFARRCTWKKHMQKQHSVQVPSQRPGRRATNIQLIGEK